MTHRRFSCSLIASFLRNHRGRPIRCSLLTWRLETTGKNKSSVIGELNGASLSTARIYKQHICRVREPPALPGEGWEGSDPEQQRPLPSCAPPAVPVPCARGWLCPLVPSLLPFPSPGSGWAGPGGWGWALGTAGRGGAQLSVRAASPCPCVLLSLCPSVLLSLCLAVPLSLYPSIPLSLCPSVLLSHYPSVPLSFCPVVSLSFCPAVPLPFCPVPLSL